MGKKKEQERIAISKLGRAGKLVNTGAKVGANYMKHYAKRLVNKDEDRTSLDEANAKDVYEAFSELKGGPLKMAQMLSMGEQMLPKSYTEQFAQAQNRVTPLSYPLIRRTFKKETGQYPEEVFEDFSKQAVNAASIGQVHKGFINGVPYAIKLQYPGVADSLKSDIRMVAPFAMRMLGMNKKDVQPYLDEVESKLLEETDYEQEFRNAAHIINGCAHLEGVIFPTFKKELSGSRVITMSWIDGLGLKDWIDSNPTQEAKNSIAQRLWDAYQYQIHALRFMHADPHPGNFIVTPNGQLGIIDFGCIKEIPDDFYASYIKLLRYGQELDSREFLDALIELGLYNEQAPEKERSLVLGIFREMFELVGRPLFSDRFDFGKDDFFKEIYERGEAMSKDSDLRGLSTAGSKHFIYFNRTFFGLYQLMNQLDAEIDTSSVLPREIWRKSA
jgi:predicted unusual protein kinase regulating ubiquinone biosynthesis (AarF/ABC1/UbiB family)